ncbi:MAG TPA: response regulator, partial [Nitrospirae bacterium]|nr:response regulator [Nitrospirota bacterium]
MSTEKNFIIIVDDDPDVLGSLSELLAEYGYPVIPCRSGEDAISQLLNNNTSLILTDIRMPGISGIDLLEKIHAIYPNMPVILMTGYAELDLAIDAVKRGAFDFITKPYNTEYLLHT